MVDPVDFEELVINQRKSHSFERELTTSTRLLCEYPHDDVQVKVVPRIVRTLDSHLPATVAM